MVPSALSIALQCCTRTSGEKRQETTTPQNGCFRVPKTSFNFLPVHTGPLGTFCALLHGEEVKDDKPTNTKHNWIGVPKKSPECGLCCARGDEKQAKLMCTTSRLEERRPSAKLLNCAKCAVSKD
ncbi:hypothetical protein V5799_034136 [Amblyomma americanum]|uniref:Uncharacterized protein n=1 Tax=Amblyomma americanum TaxID=6943 RepID=A0AAQ4DLA9_AMBAM